MTRRDLKAFLDRFPDLSILVVGDFFLDRYLVIDPALAERSLETGLEARQVTEIRNSPGAAGTVTSNLRALGAGQVRALGAIGEDGQGYDLKAGLRATGVDVRDLIETRGRFTPTYTKPILKTTGEEMERLDIKNRTPTPEGLEARIIEALEKALPEVQGVIALDQVQERDCGVVTDRVREALARLAEAYPEVVFFADSRTRIGEFRNVIAKPNREEAVRAAFPGHAGPVDRGRLEACIRSFSERTGRPVYLTLGPDGILCDDTERIHHIPGIAVPGPVDTVGAGDSVSAGVVSALCAGASYPEAGLVGALVASVTIQQIGTTGTASPEQVLDRFSETYPDGWQVA